MNFSQENKDAFKMQDPCSTMKVELPMSAAFEPKEDITAFELSKILPHFFGKALFKAYLENLGSAARHLKIK